MLKPSRTTAASRGTSPAIDVHDDGVEGFGASGAAAGGGAGVGVGVGAGVGAVWHDKPSTQLQPLLRQAPSSPCWRQEPAWQEKPSL